jgi:hypothetical protein
MSAERPQQSQNLSQEKGAELSNGGALPASHQTTEEHKPTYQVILRHLAKFRDGARAVLDLFDLPRARETPSAIVAQAPSIPSAQAQTAEAPVRLAKTPLQIRIERHMGLVDRALQQIQALNPEQKKRAELPQDLRESIAKNELMIYDVVKAELHFWAAAIQNSPVDKVDETEQAWIARILRLANILGVDDDHQEHLDFLKSWTAQVHH